jgi:hypothetical protein
MVYVHASNLVRPATVHDKVRCVPTTDYRGFEPSRNCLSMLIKRGKYSPVVREAHDSPPNSNGGMIIPAA